MQTKMQVKLERVRKVSRILRGMCTGLLVVIALVGFAGVVCLTFGVGGVNLDNRIFETSGLGLSQRLILGAVSAFAFAALFNCFYHLHQLFGNYMRGQVFTRESVGQLRQFGIACLFWGVMNFVWSTSLVLSTHQAKSFAGHYDVLGIGVVIIVIAWFMDMVVEMREENELTI